MDIPTIVILSSSADTQKKLKKDLSEFFKIKTAAAGAEVLKILKEDHTVAAILMDHSLSDYLPHLFIDKIRNNPVTRNLPFVMISREGSNSFVHQAVRSGISHYIGMPYEPSVLLEKIQMALDPTRFTKRIYFQVPCKIDVQCTSFGRISYISPTQILFETHVKFAVGDEVSITSLLAEGISETSLNIKIETINNDCFYNYPFAVTATWIDPKAAEKIRSWIQMHKSLNSPKKAKVLCIGMSFEEQEELTKQIDAKVYSLRFSDNFLQGIKELPFLKPSALVISSEEWMKTSKNFQENLLKQIEIGSIALILKGEVSEENTSAAHLIHTPNSIAAVAMAIRGRLLPPVTEPDRIYFSKALEDSRLKIYLKGRVLVLGETGVKLALQNEVQAPCNMQLDLKTFSLQNLRNPYIRSWPPMMRPTGDESDKGSFKTAYESHFLGMNDLQATEIRQWLIDDEMKDKRAKIADALPIPSQEEPEKK